MKDSFEVLNQEVISCRLCPRLVTFRETVPPAPAFQQEPHWRRPVPGFGDPKAKLLILGLAPAHQGGNRTGRIFTGDQTARFLMKHLHTAGFANKPDSLSKEDGLILSECYMTASVKCAPPQHRPLLSEFQNCSRYLHREIQLLPHLKTVLVLGQKAFESYLRFLKEKEALTYSPIFSHGASYTFDQGPTLYVSYHPTPRNVNTGLLTDEMFLSLLMKIKKELA